MSLAPEGTPLRKLQLLYGVDLEDFGLTATTRTFTAGQVKSDLFVALTVLNGVDDETLDKNLEDFEKTKDGPSKNEIKAQAQAPYEAMAALLSKAFSIAMPPSD